METKKDSKWSTIPTKSMTNGQIEKYFWDIKIEEEIKNEDCNVIKVKSIIDCFNFS